ncbi:MAG: DUF2807 domain-containing protein [Steroidobacter sp.]
MSFQPVVTAIVGAALFLSGCGRNGGGDDGPTITEKLDVEAFDAIEIKGAARLEITIGEPLSVVVSGRENAVRRVETRVSGDTLRIRSRARDWAIRDGVSRLTFQITMPRLESLELEGGNDVNVVGFAGGDTKIRSSGAVNLNANGHLEKLKVRMSGAGHADLSRLLANEADVTVDGVGNVIVSPRDSLEATMNGVGAIFYTGSPRQVKTRMNGLGTIGQRDSAPAPEAEPTKPVDPDELQPEYEDPTKKKEEVDYKKDVTEVI